MGESTTDQIVAEYSNAQSWPTLLEQILNENGIPTRVYNLGKAGINSYLIAKDLQENIDHFNPDLIISMVGINDIITRGAFHESQTDLPFYTQLKIFKFAKWFSIFQNSNESYGAPKHPIAELQKVLADFQSKSLNQTEIKNWLSVKFPNPKERANFAADLADQVFGNVLLVQMAYRNQDEASKKKIKLLHDLIDIIEQTGYNLREVNNLRFIYYSSFHESELCYKLAEKLATQGYFFEMIEIDMMLGCVSDSPQKLQDWKRILKDQPNFVDLEPTERSTAQNYNYIYKTAKKNNIKFLTMQYPVRSIASLLNYFSTSDQKEITFISNEVNFKEKLRTTNYDNLFVDHFAPELGHATTEGNRLIAIEAAKAIYQGIQDKKK